MELDKESQTFVNLVTNGGNKKIIMNKHFYKQLLNIDNGDGEDIINIISENPLMLVAELDEKRVVYDYFYDYVLQGKGHPTHMSAWYTYLVKVSKMLSGLGSRGDIIKSDKRYILGLQHNNENYNMLFETLIDNYFDVGDFDFLLQSVIARGEMFKLKILCDTYDHVEVYMGLIDVALKFGRLNILRYLLYELEMAEDFEQYGRVMEFANYEDNPRYMYYHQNIGKNFENYGTIAGSTQDYVKCVDEIMSIYTYGITIKTLDIWCETARHKMHRSYRWDRIPNELLLSIKNHISLPVPLNHDFGEFNNVIFGNDWSNRSYLVSQYIDLQEKHQKLQERCAKLEYKFRTLRDRNEYLEQRQFRQRAVRRRYETE